MIVTILFVLRLLLELLTLDSDSDGEYRFWSWVIFMAVSITLGYTGADSERKAHLEEAISSGSHYATYEAFWYNKRLEFFDNHFCRFTLRPDSDYIDVEYYEGKQNG